MAFRLLSGGETREHDQDELILGSSKLAQFTNDADNKYYTTHTPIIRVVLKLELISNLSQAHLRLTFGELSFATEHIAILMVSSTASDFDVELALTYDPVSAVMQGTTY